MMADKTITALTATTSAVAADEIPMWVAGSAVTRKITRANFLTGYGALATASTWTAAQTMQAGVGIGVASSLLYRPTTGVVRQKLESNTISNLGALTVSNDSNGRGLVYVYNASAGGGALFLVNGGAGTLVAGAGAAFTGTAGNSGTVNVYATGGNILVENRTGGTITAACWVVL